MEERIVSAASRSGCYKRYGELYKIVPCIRHGDDILGDCRRFR